MANFKVWDVVKVPFPYTDRPVREHRPALVIGVEGIEENYGLLWVLMITSEKNRGWIGDIKVSDQVLSGLPAPSVVRTAKFATIEARDAERIGVLPASDRALVGSRLRETWGEALFLE